MAAEKTVGMAACILKLSKICFSHHNREYISHHNQEYIFVSVRVKDLSKEPVLWTVRSVIIGMRFAERTTGAVKSGIIDVCQAKKSSKEVLLTTLVNHSF